MAKALRLHWSRPKSGELLLKLSSHAHVRFFHNVKTQKWKASLLTSAPSLNSKSLMYEVVRPLEAILNGSFILHGALLKKGRRSCLIVAESGAGKSTLTAHLINAGWDALSDDMSELRFFKGRRIKAHGVRKTLSLDRKSLKLLRLGTFHPGEEKRVCKLKSTTKVVTLRSVVILKRSKKFKVRSVSKVEAMSLLLKSSWRPPLNLDSSFPRFISDVAKLVENVPCQVVEYPRRKTSLARMEHYLAKQ